MTIANFFVPNRQTVSDISRTNPGVVTTTQNHGYDSGLFVRFYFPVNFGMTQVNGKIYEITVLSPTTFEIDVDTTNFDTFAILSPAQTPQVIPVGEVSSTLTMAVDNNENIIPEL
jgi:hypothetical protein